ncbi:mandelate racemase/muconate lactonizing enzyme family protein [Silvimonas iriomotensis]|uniref:Mandelate racemase n=1 Tax=Silvimonas iriomotensis TaxID=449662 RepID=A0ABQ2P7Y2_9NEIS|nr:mandelate racemase/muconate lactonizing enzyme family protein [Silvimonas iriomotensis]GGP20125.1 mandelate racemase [Silvimonas iriomotensis]
MAKITAVHLYLVNLPPKTVRTDAIQSFVTQETPIVRIVCDDGSEGIGYSYTIGTGGSSVIALIKDHLAPQLPGRDPACVEAIWRDLLFHTHATAVGAITSLALAAIDTALWDWRARRADLPLWQLLGGAQPQVPVYTTEGGWLQLPQSALVEQTLAARAAGFKGAKLKVGKPHLAEDVRRLHAVREAVGDDFELMVDANQAFSVSEAMRRADVLAGVNLAWLEEPLPADNVAGHTQLAAHSRIPIAVGESLYSPGQFADYIQHKACSIIQVDVARVGGITPWLKVAHMAACHNLAVCPHFLMELHVSLCSAVPNAAWLEYIPQLDDVTARPIRITDGMATPPDEAGLGIAWDWPVLEKRSLFRHTLS